MSSLQKTRAKRTKASGRGASAKYLWRKQFRLGDKSMTIRLGNRSKESAEEISGHIDHLLECYRYGTEPKPETKSWLQNAEEKLVGKLAKLGLCNATNNPLVERCVADYIERKKIDWHGSTENNFRQVERLLVERFENRRMSQVSVADAKDYWSWMRSVKKHSDNTARKHFQRTRQIFDDAVERDIIPKNPFRIKEIKVSVGVAEKQYVEESTIEAIVDSLPEDKLEWKLLFKLARYLGLRMPSEIRELTIEDVDWGTNTITLKSPKTKRYGKGTRRVPIFVEIEEALLKQIESLPDGSVHLFPKLRQGSNLSTMAKRYVEKARVDVWPEFWNSLRASRETDLMDSHGLRRACAWIGNNATTAMRHYSLMRECDFIDEGLGSKATRKATRHDAESERIGEKEIKKTKETLVITTRSTPKRNRTSS